MSHDGLQNAMQNSVNTNSNVNINSSARTNPNTLLPISPEQFWTKDPLEFFLDVENYTKIIPSGQMSLVEQLNASFRFSILFSLVIIIIRHDVRVIFFALFVAFLTMLIHKYSTREEKGRKGVLEKMNIQRDRYSGYCLKPTRENPFMNPNPTDYGDFPNRPPACRISKPSVQNKIQEYMDEGVYRDVDDIYGKIANDRQFYTMPNTTIPNDQKKFAEFLYVQNAPKAKGFALED